MLVLLLEVGGNDACRKLSQCASYRNYWRYYIWPLFIFKWKWEYAKQLTYTRFVNKLNKGDLKTLEIQPEQNVYMVSGKTKR